MTIRSVLVVCAAMATGCDLLPLEGSDGSKSTSDTGATEPGTGDDDDGTPGTTDDTDTGTDTDTDTVSFPEGWTFSSHPCVGYRTDTLWVDDNGTMWVGCGTTADGYGVYRSRDGGLTWDAPETDPPDYVADMRVDSITRSTDGVMYIGGIHGAEQVVALDTSVEPMVVSEVFTSTSQVWNTFQVGAFRRNSQGYAVAESLNGNGLAFRRTDADPFEDGSGWQGSGSYQILDLALHDDQFYGVGSTIAQPPYVYLPPEGGLEPDDAFAMVPIQMSEGLGAWIGELWGLDVDDHGVVAVGVDQDRHVGYVFTSPADPWDLENWRELDVSTIVGDEPSWMRGACRNGATVIAVGEYSSTSMGIVLRSDDDGATFVDITPSDLIDLPAVQRCDVREDGTVIIAGGNGVVAILR
jgi:hypothetical protein